MKGWKTIAFNVLMAILLVVDQQGVDVWGLTTEWVAIIGTIGNFILRFLTSTPVGKSK